MGGSLNVQVVRLQGCKGSFYLFCSVIFNKIIPISLPRRGMKENNMTTIIVHQILSHQKAIKPLFNENPIININMHYELESPAHYADNVRDRIRSRSFYDQKKQSGDRSRKMGKNRTYLKFAQKQQQSLSEAKVIDLEFQNCSRPKAKKQNSKSSISTHQYYSLMVNSMQTYIRKVEKGKQKKQEKCQKLRSFGVNIQSIKAKPDEERLAEYISRQQKMGATKDLVNASDDISLNQVELKNNRSLIEQMNSNNRLNKTILATPGTKKSKFLSKKIMFRQEKKDDDRKLTSKLNRMFNHFYIILSAYGVCLDRSEEKKAIETEKMRKSERKYTYFVGNGNNKNLIVSILKKRWWWSESQDIASANFVWTQLKIPSILQKQASMNYSQLEEVQPYLYAKNENDSLTKLDQIKQQAGKIHNIFHKNHSKIFHNKLVLKQERRLLRQMKVPKVVHNHYEANFMLGNKKALFYNMSEFKEYRKENIFDYIPLTYHVEKINSKAYKQFEKRAKQEKKSLWIVKPGENSNRGQGIFVSDSIQAIRSRIEKNKKHTYIIQKYIKNNLTFQKRKFDIRTYLLMVSIGGVLKFYWYSEGYLRTSSQIYDLSDLDDPFIHLTNDAIQVNSDNYGKFEKGNKITYSQFQRYLDLHYPNEKLMVGSLVENMKNIAREVVQATYFKIDPCRKEYSFQLFGMDFLVDKDFKPWLLEVNTNPCLELSSPVLERLIPRMVQNLFRIVVDPVFEPFENQFPRNLACYVPDNIIESNRFELIFDSLHDRDDKWQAYSRSLSSTKVYEDENQQFENDGEIIRIQD